MIANFKDKNNGTGGGGKPVVTEELNVVENGIYNVPDGVDAYNPVNVDVSTISKGFDFSQISKGFSVATSISESQLLTVFDKTGLDLSKCTAFYCGSTYIESLDIGGLNTTNLTTFSIYNQYNKLALKELDISGLDLTNVTNLKLYRLVYLETVKSDGLKLPDVDMEECVWFGDDGKLTVDSIVGLLNALPQSTHNYSFRIGLKNKYKLSDEQKNIATSKGWRLV